MVDHLDDLSKYLSILCNDADIHEVRPIWAATESIKSSSRGKTTWGTAAEILASAETLVAHNAAGANIYVGVLPRRAHGCTTGDGSLGGFVLVADADDGRSLAELKADMAKAGIPEPTMTVCSCEGLNKFHFYWVLLSRLEDVKLFERGVAGINDALGTDASVGPGAQLLRLPGPFTNVKAGRGGRVMLVEACPERRYSIAQFPLAEEVPDAPPPPAKLADYPVQIQARTMSDATKALLVDKVDQVDYRRRSIYTAACDLKAREWPIEEALQMLVEAGERLGLDGHDLTDLRRQVHRAYAKPRAPGKASTEEIEIDFEASAAEEYDAELEAMPLPEIPAWPSRPDIALGHGALGEVVAALEEQTEADATALAIQTLVAFGSAVGRGPHVMVGATRHGCNLFACIVGETGKARKGTGLDIVRYLLGQADPQWASECITPNLSSGEGLIDAIRDPVEKIVIDKKTGGASSQVVDAGVEDKRLLVACTELAGPLRASKNERSTLSPTLREAWDGKDLRTLAKNAARRATDPHISVIAHVTREELLKLATDSDVFGGLFNRFLWPLSRRVRFLPDGGSMRDLPRLGDLLRDRVDLARGVGEMVRTEAAADLWRDVYRPLTDIADGGVLGAILGRGEAQTLRLAMIMALLAGRLEVDRADLEAALDLWWYCDASARVIFTLAESTASLGSRIVAKVTAAGQAGITRTALANTLKVRRELRPAFVAELARASSRGLIVANREPTSGRPREVWTAADPLSRTYKRVSRTLENAKGQPEKTAFHRGNSEVSAPADPLPVQTVPPLTKSVKGPPDLSKPLPPGVHSL